MMDHDVAAPDVAFIDGVLSAMATPFVATTAVTVYELMAGTAGLFTWMVIVNPALCPPELLALIVYLAKARTRGGKKERGEKRVCVCVRTRVCVSVIDTIAHKIVTLPITLLLVP